MSAPPRPTPAALAELLRPRLPSDGLPFGELAERYNFLTISSYGRAFTHVLIDELQQRGGGAALDVGCGCGIGREVAFQWAVKEAATELWGLEPDRSIVPQPGLFDNFQHALMETAELPDNHFALAYSSMVMEHVEHPAAFLERLARALKPGGVYLFVTPNAHSFVPLMTKVMHQAKIDEWAVRMVRGKQQVEEYHYPVQFRFNSPAQIAAHAQAAGFLPPQVAYIEGTGSYSYLRGPLVPLRGLIKAKRRMIKAPARLATMIGRLVKG